jgi:hypothetical protein
MSNWGVRAGVFAASLLGVAAMGVVPGADAAGQGGAVHIYSQGTGVTTPILITGAITDYGKSTSVDKSGKPDENGNYEKIVLEKGTFWVDTTKLNKVFAAAAPTIDKTHCFFAFKGSAPTTLINGTGAYAGIGGTVTVTVDFVGIGARLANGTCNISQNSQPAAQFGNVTGSGDATFK